MAKRNIIDEEKLARLIDKKRKDIDRYYQTILATLGLKIFIEAHPEAKCEFIGAEIDLKREEDNKPLRPDILLQSKDLGETYGIAIEVKSSLSTEDNIISELKDMERYNSRLIGWKTADKNVHDHVMVFAPHIEYGGKCRRLVEEGVAKEELTFSKDLLVWQWDLSQSTKYGVNLELLIIQQLYGSLKKFGMNILDKHLVDGIKVDINDNQFIVQQEMCWFTRQEPPIEYTMVFLWQNVLGKLCNSDNGYLTTADIISEEINKFQSPLMVNTDGHQFKVKVDWIKKAIDKFKEIKLAEDAGTRVKILLDKNVTTKDIEQYICEKTARNELRYFHDEGQQKI